MTVVKSHNDAAEMYSEKSSAPLIISQGILNHEN